MPPEPDPSIQTHRLELRPLAPAAAAALPDDRVRAEREIEAAISPDWPQPDLLDVLPRQAAASVDGAKWGIWVIFDRRDEMVVGDIGFFGPPTENGIVEIGYSVVPTHRRRGYATEAATVLIQWARQQPGVAAVVAGCDPDNEPSIRTLRRVGFSETGRIDREIRWRA